MPDFTKQLSKYIPIGAAPIISEWINDTGCQFKVAKSRATKFGDYQAPFKQNPHKISINHDLNPYAFLVTTIHEFAHLKTFQHYKNTVKPHGLEWKNNFKSLMQPFLKLNIFPNAILIAIVNYMENPAASSCTDLNLYRALRDYDKVSNMVTVETLAEEDLFSMKNGRVFQKKEKVRKRYRCIELKTNKIYLFHPIAEVYELKNTLETS